MKALHAFSISYSHLVSLHGHLETSEVGRSMQACNEQIEVFLTINEKRDLSEFLALRDPGGSQQ